jgi:hypothetical protein
LRIPGWPGVSPSFRNAKADRLSSEKRSADLPVDWSPRKFRNTSATDVGVALDSGDLGHEPCEAGVGTRPPESCAVSLTVGSILVSPPFSLYLRAPTARLLQPWTDSIRIGTQPGLTLAASNTLATLILSVLFLLALPLILRISSRMSARVGAIAWPMLAAFLPIQFVTVALGASRLSYTIQESTSELRSLIGQEARAIDGSVLVFGTQDRNLILSDRRWAGYGFYGKELIPSFQPTHMAFPHRMFGGRVCTESARRAFGMGSLRSWNAS